MSPSSEPIGELDLLAYADGLLDPARAAAVERRLVAHPEDAAKVEAYRRQNEAIVASFGAARMEPVPERILAAIYERPAPPLRRLRALSQIAAGIAAVLAAGLLGWYMGRVKPPDATISAFVEEVQRLSSESDALGSPAADPAEASPLRRLAQDVAAHLVRLSGEGQPLTFTQQRLIAHNGQEIAQFTFKDQAGKLYRLFMAPRPSYRGPNYQLRHGGQQSIAYWADGPIVFALASDDKPSGGDKQALMKFAQAIDRAVCTEDETLVSANY